MGGSGDLRKTHWGSARGCDPLATWEALALASFGRLWEAPGCEALGGFGRPWKGPLVVQDQKVPLSHVFGSIFGKGFFGGPGRLWEALGTPGDTWGRLGTPGDAWGRLGTPNTLKYFKIPKNTSEFPKIP